MKILTRIEDALDIYKSDVAERTFKWIFNELHHTCYLLVVKDGVPSMFKLDPPGVPASLRKTLKQKTKLAKTLRNKPLRLMGCVVKVRKEGTTTHEFPRWIESMPYKLPEGAYILNLTDAVILRKEGEFLPVLSGSGAHGFHDIPIPNYDDVRIAMGFDTVPTFETTWSEKKPIAVFRGGPTGCGTTSRTNQRLKLAEMMGPDLDVGITRTKSSNPRIDPERGLSMIETTVSPVPFMSMEDQSKHKYIIHVDGNVAAYRLLTTLLTGSLILRVKSVYTLWSDSILEDGVHYISVAEDLSDLESILAWCKKNDAKCRSIAKKGRTVAQKLLSKEFIDAYFVKVLRKIKRSS